MVQMLCLQKKEVYDRNCGQCQTILLPLILLSLGLISWSLSNMPWSSDGITCTSSQSSSDNSDWDSILPAGLL